VPPSVADGNFCNSEPAFCRLGLHLDSPAEVGVGHCEPVERRAPDDAQRTEIGEPDAPNSSNQPSGKTIAKTLQGSQRARLRFARYPVHKTLAGFDFDFQPQLDRALVAELSTLRFVEERRNVLLLAPASRATSAVRSSLPLSTTTTSLNSPVGIALRSAPTLPSSFNAGIISA